MAINIGVQDASLDGNETANLNIPVIVGNPDFYVPSNTIAMMISTSADPNYFQINVHNNNTSSTASADFIATADNGNDTSHYVDIGINSSLGGGAPFTNANAGYIYSTDSEIDIGALGTTGVVNFYTTGGTSSPVLGMSLSSNQSLSVTGGGIFSGATSSNNNSGVKLEYASGAGYVSSGASNNLSFGNGNSTSGVPANIFATINSAGSLSLFGAKPTSSVGTVATGSTTNKGQITGLTGATSVTITFAANAPLTSAAPACVVIGSTALASPAISAISSTAVTITMTAFTGTLYYVCF